MQFKLKDKMYFCQDAKGNLRQLPRYAMKEEIFSADGTLKLDYQKNGWKVVWVYQEHNGDEKFSSVRAWGRRLVSIRNKVKNLRHTCQHLGQEAKDKILIMRTLFQH